MWRDEVGMMEMLLSYISEFNTFDRWSNWRPILVDILSCHEGSRRKYLEIPGSAVKNEDLGTFVDSEEFQGEDIGETDESRNVHDESTALPFDNGLSREVKRESDDQIEVDEAEEDVVIIDIVPENVLEGSGPGNRLIQGHADSSLISSNKDDNRCFKDVHERRALVGNPEESAANSFFLLNANGFPESQPDNSERIRVVPLVDRRRREGSETVKSGEKRRYECDVCGRTYGRISDMNIHKRLHTGERPYFCNICGKSFYRSNCYNSHKRTHIGEHPFYCKTCGKSFGRRSNFNVHLRKNVGHVG